MCLKKIRQICRQHGGQCGKCPLRDAAGSICGIPGEMSDIYISRVEGLLDVTPIHPKRKLSDEDVDAIAIAVTKSLKKYLEED